MLAEAHNRVVTACAEDLGLVLPAATELRALTDGQLVTFRRRELQLLLLVHSECSLRVGQEGDARQWDVNLGSLEQHCVEQ